MTASKAATPDDPAGRRRALVRSLGRSVGRSAELNQTGRGDPSVSHVSSIPNSPICNQ